MKKAIFKHPSTFTYLGRHASELKFLLRRAKNRNEILNIGPGPFEPFYIAALSPNSRITVVDINPRMLQMVASIKDGVSIPLREAAQHCHNVQNDGSPRANRDLLLPERIEQGLNELRIAGLNPADFVQSDSEFVYRRRSDIQVMQPMDISETEVWKQFDVVFEGLVLLNLNKTLDTEQFKSTVDILGMLTKKDGVLGIGITPAGISGSKRYIHTLMDVLQARFRLQELIVDNLVDGGSRGLAGGYLATFSDQWSSHLDFEKIKGLIMQEQMLSRAKFIFPYIPEEKLLELLNDQEYLLIAAIHSGGSYYKAAFAELGSMQIPTQRYQFSVMASLK
jgi:hypothetical protein